MSDFIRYYDNVLTKEQCEDLIEYSNLLYDTNSSSVKKQYGDRNYYRIKKDAYSKEQINLIENTLEIIYNNYKNDFTLNEDYSKITNNWKIHYTPADGYIDWHNDLGGKNDEAWKRKIVFIIYLNDLYNGELKFKYFHDVQIMPKAGRVLVMPTGWPWTHKADNPFEEKYILTGFYYDKEDKC